MRKILALVLALCLALSMAACAGDNTSSSESSAAGESSAAEESSRPRSPLKKLLRRAAKPGRTPPSPARLSPLP